MAYSQKEERRPLADAPILVFELDLAVAARGCDALARQPFRSVGGEEHRHLRDIVGLAETAERGARHDLLLEVAADHADLVRALGLDASGRDDVDADVARGELARQLD